MADPHYLELIGDAYQRGLTHGGELRQQVTACVDFYRGLLNLGEDELTRRAAVFEKLIIGYAPQQAEEIRGIAAGSGLPVAHIYAINARSELAPFTTAECTVLCSPQAAILGQTWDWCRPLEELVTLLSITHDSGHRVLTVTEPGIVGKIGLSSAGTAVCLNFLAAPRAEDGVPVHSLLRQAMDAGSMEAARRDLQRAGVGHGGNILLASASGEAANFEFAGDNVDERVLESNFAHTNHCLFRHVPAGEFEDNSLARLDRAEQLLAAQPDITIEGFKNILSDRQQAEDPIWSPYKTVFGLEIGTLCTVIMDLSRRELHLRLGTDHAADFSIHRL